MYEYWNLVSYVGWLLVGLSNRIHRWGTRMIARSLIERGTILYRSESNGK